MKLFIDSADPKEIAALAATGLVDGVPTNPSLAAKTGQNLFDALRSICDLVPGSVSAEVTATEKQSFFEEDDRMSGRREFISSDGAACTRADHDDVAIKRFAVAEIAGRMRALFDVAWLIRGHDATVDFVFSDFGVTVECAKQRKGCGMIVIGNLQRREQRANQIAPTEAAAPRRRC